MTVKRQLLTFLKILTGLGAVYYLWHKKNFAAVFTGLELSLDIWLWVLLLSVLNWFWEVKKWQYLVSHVQEISFKTAAYQSLTGFAVSMLTPNRIGEYGAKVLFYKPDLRKKIFSLSLIGNFSQLGATILFGLLGILWVIYKKIPSFNQLTDSPVYTWLWILLIILVLYVLYRKFLHNRALIVTDLKIWVGSFRYALLRYLAFATEFYLLFASLDTHVNQLQFLLAGISIMYLLSAFIPMLAFLDWAVKGSVAIWVFGKLGLNEDLALKVTTLMWFFNFFLPFIAGTLLFLTKTNNKTKETNKVL